MGVEAIDIEVNKERKNVGGVGDVGILMGGASLQYGNSWRKMIATETILEFRDRLRVGDTTTDQSLMRLFKVPSQQSLDQYYSNGIV